MRAVGTGETEVVECGLVLRSIGYRGEPLPDVPFDERRGVIPNRAGRVTETSTGPIRPREYAVGWIKRGPTGIIGTNKRDAVETVQSMAEDVATLRAAEIEPDPDRPLRLLRERGIRVVDLEDWSRIDAAEVARGESEGRPRNKFVRVEEMLRLCEEEAVAAEADGPGS